MSDPASATRGRPSSTPPDAPGAGDGGSRSDRIDARVYLKADAPAEAITALHDDVFRTSPVGNTLERPASLQVELIRQ